jgi:hypothetical protein
MECHYTLFGIIDRGYESILGVINDRTETNGYETIDFYEAVATKNDIVFIIAISFAVGK